MENNYLMFLKPSLNTLSTTYSNSPDQYMFKRAMIIQDQSNDNLIEDPMKKYKEAINTAINTPSTINLNYPYFIYDSSSNTISCNIPSLLGADSYTVEQMQLINKNNLISTDGSECSYSYSKKNASLTITMPTTFDSQTTVFLGTLNAKITDNVTLLGIVQYTPPISTPTPSPLPN